MTTINHEPYIELARNKTHKLLQNAAGLQCCIDFSVYPGGPETGPGRAQWEAAGTWDLGKGGGYCRRQHSTANYGVPINKAFCQVKAN